MSKELRLRPTAKRIEWLTELSRGPAKRHAKSRVGFDCARLGLTEWCDTDLPAREWKERLTDAGRAFLATVTGGAE